MNSYYTLAMSENTQIYTLYMMDNLVHSWKI